ncbi:beta-1-6-glucanase [Penicillium lagena]|uniref:beta-1-6-glucanase n=1 Tax=Penicillium lagena TaxID=94218 RepID=UPI002541C40A|nr:beta-1-6-glucanase [Penicillium lagena]KAJ5620399.1 beta-1-6-glucanase [Penicillium lagena]
MAILQALKVAGALSLALPSAALAQPKLSKKGPASSYLTSADGAYNLTSYAAPVLGTGDSPTWSLAVDDTRSGHKQQMVGFGAAVTDATITVFSALSEAQRSALFTELLTTDGPEAVGMSLMRHSIGASDLSSYEYSYDQTPNNISPDPRVANFSLEDPGNHMVNMIAEFKKYNPDLRLLGSVWSPPGWMKNNHVQDGNATDNTFNMKWAGSYAEYFVKYIQAFRKKGVQVDAITIQNEPLNSNPGYPTMYLPANESTAIIQHHVGPSLKSAGLNTEIWAYDHNTDVPEYPQTVLDGAGDYVNNVAWHCYATNNTWDVLTQFHKKNPKATQYMTECWTSPYTSWYQVPYFVMGPIQNWAVGAIAWTLGTTFDYNPHLPGGCNSCRGFIEVDPATGTYKKTTDYYMMGQFSKFVPRGAIALSTSASFDVEIEEKIATAAFLNPDHSRTVVIYNGFPQDGNATVNFASGESWTGQVYQKSVVTWTLPPAQD